MARVVLCLLLVSVQGLLQDLKGQGLLQKDHLRVIQGTPLENEHQEMLFNHLTLMAKQATQERLARLEAIGSEADFRAWQNTNRQKFLDFIGGLPADRTPLNPHVMGELKRDDYIIRKIIFESLPNYYVTANLYLPTNGKPPYPTVLCPLGHSRNGKAYDEYQHLFVGLVKRGYVVLAYDAPGQGERIQYWDFLTNQRAYQFRSNEHGLYGVQECLLGQNLSRYMIWDGIRALDYLTSLPEVDATRIGVTGNSGGGTLTTYISILDPRVKVAAPVTFTCSIPKKIEARIADSEADPEQDIAGLLGAGLDHAEEVGMIAPRPVLIGAATRDFFPIEGTRATYRELQRLYTKLGIPERVKMVEFNHEHMYSQPLREATYAWFDRWLKGVDHEAHEPEITAEKDEALQCTATGQVVTSLGGNRIQDFNRAEADRLSAELVRRRMSPAFRQDLPARIKKRLALPETAFEPRAKGLGEITGGDLTVEKLLLETEPGIVVPVRAILSKGSPGRRRAVVYLRDRDGSRDDPAIFESLARSGRIVLVADVRGFGETMSRRSVPDTRIGYFHPRDAMDADFCYASFFLGRPLLGMRVWDALQVLAYARTRPDVDPGQVSLAGHGWAGTIAIFAGALDPKVSAVAVESVPTSYAGMARVEADVEPVSLMLPGVLKDFDLEDVMGAISPRPLLVQAPVDALDKKMPAREASQAMKPVSESYAPARAAKALTVRTSPYASDIEKELESWLLQN